MPVQRTRTGVPRVGRRTIRTRRGLDFSFPSDHATVAGAVAAGLFLANRRLGVIASVAALAMAFARVYVGTHYPGDVVGGLLLGAAVAVAGSYLATPLLRQLTDRLTASPLRRLLTSAR